VFFEISGKIEEIETIAIGGRIHDIMRIQKRFKHLFSSDEGCRAAENIQAHADKNIEKFGLEEIPSSKIKNGENLRSAVIAKQG